MEQCENGAVARRHSQACGGLGRQPASVGLAGAPCKVAIFPRMLLKENALVNLMTGWLPTAALSSLVNRHKVTSLKNLEFYGCNAMRGFDRTW